MISYDAQGGSTVFVLKETSIGECQELKSSLVTNLKQSSYAVNTTFCLIQSTAMESGSDKLKHH